MSILLLLSYPKCSSSKLWLSFIPKVILYYGFKFTFVFLALLKTADLTKTSAKKIRQELEKKLDTDLDDR